MTTAEGISMTDLHARATKIFGASSNGIHWPYGLEAPSRLLRREKAEFDRLIPIQQVKQQTIVEWAERHGLKRSETGCCPHWLQRKASRRCSDKCTRYGSNIPDQAWLDHTVAWIKDGKPAAITSAPYQLGQNDTDRIGWWLTQDARLRAAYGTGWYGGGTIQVVIWRADRIETVEPVVYDEAG